MNKALNLMEKSVKVPDWALKNLYKSFNKKLSASAKVYLFPKCMDAASFFMTTGKVLEIGNSGRNEHFMFFIDQFPDANWAHDSAYVLVNLSGHATWTDCRWPPDDNIQLCD
ncbi:MAG TPA: hypothetical protein ENI61_00490 [Ignavibacteria bacterium]|nr:hypothetical protein [Ignavibacteria bacterium]